MSAHCSTGLDDVSAKKLVSDTCLASFAGFVFGGGLSIRAAADDFIEANRTTKYTNKYHMQARLGVSVSIPAFSLSRVQLGKANL
jgi:hypothetical protein